MSHWKGDFEGFYNAGIRNTLTATEKTIDSFAAEFAAKSGKKGAKAVADFAAELKSKLNEDGIKEKYPYDYTSTQGYRYHM